MRGLALGLVVGTASTGPAFVPVAPSQGRPRSCPTRAWTKTGSFYDSYDADAARNQEQDRPDWAGGGIASNLINALIANKFLFSIM
jgi:hypothetical protein